jgi:hypothetical protein
MSCPARGRRSAVAAMVGVERSSMPEFLEACLGFDRDTMPVLRVRSALPEPHRRRGWPAGRHNGLWPEQGGDHLALLGGPGLLG